jgi:AcrR family transcriptional regulator
VRGRSAGAAEFQRTRILKAAVEVASERGYERATATAVIARAGISRKTFYDLYEGRDECVLAALEQFFAQLAAVVAPACVAQDAWAERLRAALLALLVFLEREHVSGGLALSYLVGCGPRSPRLRTAVLERARGAVGEGRSQRKRGRELSPLTEEAVVGGVLAVMHARLRTDPQRLGALANQLMWMIVLPYLGPAAAARQLTRTAPSPLVPLASAGDPLRKLEMRLTYRTGRTLEVIAVAPGASNGEIADRVEVADRGQMSKLLARLARLGFVENTGPGQVGGGANAWHLTPRGQELEAAIRRKSAMAGR